MRPPQKTHAINGRAAFLLCAFLFVPVLAQAQRPGNPTANLAARVAALEAAVAKLEGRIAAADLVGEYRLAGFLADPDTSNPPQIAFAVAYGTVTLLADGTSSMTGAIQGTEFILSNPAQESPIFQQDNDFPGTWTYADGTLTITSEEPGDAPLVLNVGAGGRVLTSAHIGDDGDHDLFILTRLR